MNYQIWESYPPESGFAFIESQVGLSEQHKIQLLSGQKVAEPLPDVTITSLSSGQLGDTLGTSYWGMVVSNPLQQILTECCNVQFIPVRIAHHAKEAYAIANILDKVACVDHNRSQFERYPEPPHTIYHVSKLVLVNLPIDMPALFRLTDLTDVILIRNDVRMQLQAASTTTGIFTPVEDFTYGFSDE